MPLLRGSSANRQRNSVRHVVIAAGGDVDNRRTVSSFTPRRQRNPAACAAVSTIGGWSVLYVIRTEAAGDRVMGQIINGRPTSWVMSPSLAGVTRSSLSHNGGTAGASSACNRPAFFVPRRFDDGRPVTHVLERFVGDGNDVV